jgi:hypothetical protein
MPQQPNDTLVKAANVVKISSLFMAELSSANRNRNKGDSLGRATLQHAL